MVLETDEELKQINELVDGFFQKHKTDRHDYEVCVDYDKSIEKWRITETPLKVELAVPKPNEFPNALGPFGVVPTKLSLYVHGTIQELLKPNSSVYYEVRLADKLNILEKLGVMSIGRFSPANLLTLTPDNKKLASIPESAEYFVWAYPLAQVGTLTDKRKRDLATNDPDLCFLIFGGYVYFNSDGDIVQVNAVGKGEGLHFSEPQKWKKAYTKKLLAQGRFQDITIQSMRDQGARQFCWIRPGEALYDEEGKNRWVCCENGAFAYLFHENESDWNEKDCYFAIRDVTDIYSSTESVPVVGVTPFSIVRGNTTAQNNVTICVECRDKNREVIFGPCNHFLTCKDCAQRLNHCPLCTLKISTKGNVFT
eukprot:c17547_g1_i1.p1 GENE.c17547_g1_i1~~c17547_g1_i1.p1  ORF type:complete len:392 (+),score=152.49 c17547_g1_i1:76-1176(+)